MTHRPGVTRNRWALIALSGLLLLQLQALLGGTALAATNSACNGAFQGSPEGSLAMTASVPDGGTISAGQTIDITITWDPNDWTSLDQLYDCFTINGTLDDSLTYGEKPPANDGVAHDSFSVPNNLSDGDEVCARSRLSGQPSGSGTSTQKSNVLCWTVGSTPKNPDVKVTKSASSSVVASGDSVTFTITASNIGDATATNVQVTDTLDGSLTITSVSNSCTVSGQTVTCDLGDLAPGDSASVTIAVRTTDGSCPSVSNSAHVSASNEASGQSGNNDSNVVTVDVTCVQPSVPPGVQPGAIAVRIVKTNDANGDGTYTDNEEARRSGQDVPFKLVIVNTGTPDVDITDLTDGFDQQTLDLLANKCPDLLRLVLASGESITCTFTLNDYSPPATSSGLVNTAEVCVENQAGDKTACDSDTSKVTSAEVLGKTITPPPPGGPPGGVAFTGSSGTTELGLAALLLLLLGTGLIRAGYRRRERYLS